MTIADSNVLIDVVRADPLWALWSSARLGEAAARAELTINPVIYAEIAPAFASVSELDLFLVRSRIEMVTFTREVLFEAGLAHARYRARGGHRDRVLPDFFIGAQARILKRPLLTRDAKRYRTYFPDVRLITP